MSIDPQPAPMPATPLGAGDLTAQPVGTGSTRRTKIVGTAVAAIIIAAIAGTIGFAAGQGASTPEEQFVAALNDHGIWVGKPDEQRIDAGKTICNALVTGNSLSYVITLTAYGAALPTRETAYIVDASKNAFCPTAA